ncbi:MAG: hypothetical protein N3A54_01270 [Patescibacteria group bacterium]|nr:hypothetical protein [Patescibacteria group bacterium]
MKANMMPKISYQPQNEWESSIIAAITTRDGKLKGSYPGKRERTMEFGVAFYVWRNVAFYISPIRQHHCLPIGADFYIPMEYDELRKYINDVLDPLVDRIVESVPVLERHGLLVWSKYIC